MLRGGRLWVLSHFLKEKMGDLALSIRFCKPRNTFPANKQTLYYSETIPSLGVFPASETGPELSCVPALTPDSPRMGGPARGLAGPAVFRMVSPARSVQQTVYSPNLLNNYVCLQNTRGGKGPAGAGAEAGSDEWPCCPCRRLGGFGLTWTSGCWETQGSLKFLCPVSDMLVSAPC